MKNSPNTIHNPKTVQEKLTLAAALIGTVSLAHDLFLYNPQNYKTQAHSVAETARYAGQLVQEAVEEIPDGLQPDKK